MSQEKIWDKIAEEWNQFKKEPSQLSKEFLSSCQGNVLDLGSGSGRHITKIKNGKMFLVDFSQEMLNLAKEKANHSGIIIETKKGNLFKIPYEDNYFDNAICISALHCIKPNKHKKSIQELYRVLKTKAKALIGVWNFNSKRFNQKQGKEKLIKWTNKGKRYYYLFEESEIHKLFKDVGFKIISSHNSEMMINFIVQKD